MSLMFPDHVLPEASMQHIIRPHDHIKFCIFDENIKNSRRRHITLDDLNRQINSIQQMYFNTVIIILNLHQ